MTPEQLLQNITRLSHQFGTNKYVRGGGGNTSVKTESTLWVKPSGTTLAGLTPEKFVAMDRARLGRLYEITPPPDAAAREEWVKQIMAESVLPSSSGRASVEAPLHDTFAGRYVVHTHPALINGLTCAHGGKSACQRLFPDALWIDYTDPGYTLCIQVRAKINEYRQQHQSEPAVVMLENHGIFVAGDNPEDIARGYDDVLTTLLREYRDRSIALELPVGSKPDADFVEQFKAAIGSIPALKSLSHVAVSWPMKTTAGPLTPDHMVYAKSFYLTEWPTEAAIDAFIQRHGYAPRVVSLDQGVFGLGETEKSAQLAVELAIDGALVLQLAEAFGSANYMSAESQQFIENWEVESYRKQQQA